MNGEFEYKLLYSGQLSPVARLDENDRVVEQYVYATRVNVPDYMIKDGRNYSILTDHRGSVRMVVDASSGEIVQETEYSEFGEITDETLAEGWDPVIFGYAGGLQDRHTGLIRFGARDYDPETGRWTSKEPLGFNGSSNFYAYADNDPVNNIDITGLDWIDAVANFSAGFGDVLTSGFGLFDNSLTEIARDKLSDFFDIEQSTVDPCSNEYRAGEIANEIWGFFAGGAVSAKYLLKTEVWFLHMKNADGVGMSVIKNGKKILGVDWHKFKLGSGIRGTPGKYVNRPHIDLPTKGIKHWPW